MLIIAFIQITTSILLSELEWKALSRCRRLWAAMALSSLLRGQSAGDVSRLFECDVKDLDDLQRSAKVP